MKCTTILNQYAIVIGLSESKLGKAVLSIELEIEGHDLNPNQV